MTARDPRKQPTRRRLLELLRSATGVDESARREVTLDSLRFAFRRGTSRPRSSFRSSFACGMTVRILSRFHVTALIERSRRGCARSTAHGHVSCCHEIVMRVLLTEASGLTARQVATRSGSSVTRSRFCLRPRSSRSVVRLASDCSARRGARDHAAPQRRRVVPTQERVAVLSAFASRILVPTIVPPFDALCRVQDKLATTRTLAALDLPQPRSLIATAALRARWRRGCERAHFLRRPCARLGWSASYARDARSNRHVGRHVCCSRIVHGARRGRG